jgi:hypothetical protein
MDRWARPAMTALAYWNRRASKGMARNACPTAPQVGAGTTNFGGGLVLELGDKATGRERIV